MDGLSIVSLNVRGLRGNKRYSIYRWLRENKFSICLLQETYCTKGFDVVLNKGWNGEIIHSYSLSAHSKGVSILFAKSLEYDILSTHSDDVGRTLLVNIEINGIYYSICNVYCPNDVSERVNFLKQTAIFVQQHAVSKQNIYLGGDFNCVDSSLDKVSQKLDKSSSMLAQIKTDLKLLDIWRVVNPGKNEYSFIDPTGQGRDSRIDLWLISKSNSKYVTSCNIVQSPAPDHRAVVLSVKKCSKPRGKGYWKMNNSVISDEKYKEGIIRLFNNVTVEYQDVSPVLLWEYLKVKIKEFTIAYCISKSQSNKNQIKELEEKLDALDKAHKNDDNRQERKILKQQYDNLYEQKAKGYQIRSRSKWVEDGEKSSAYFLSLEKIKKTSFKHY